MYNNILCFFIDPGIIPKKHRNYYYKNKDQIISIDNDAEPNNIFIFKMKEKIILPEEIISKEESQSLNLKTDINNATIDILDEVQQLNIPEIYKYNYYILK